MSGSEIELKHREYGSIVRLLLPADMMVVGETLQALGALGYEIVGAEGATSVVATVEL